MPNTTKINSVKTEEVDNSKIALLEKENKEIREQLDRMLKMMEAQKRETVTLTEDSEASLEEPSPNKTIRLMSLCRGSLNLAEDESGTGKIKFSKYGEVKTILYSSLIRIVNNNRAFAEKGYFYILDKAAVYYLGLNDCYSKIITKDVMDNILKYEDVDIARIIENTDENQVETMVKNLTDRVYNGESVDLNKVQYISRKTNIDILSKVNEMKNFDNLK